MHASSYAASLTRRSLVGGAWMVVVDLLRLLLLSSIVTTSRRTMPIYTYCTNYSYKPQTTQALVTTNTKLFSSI